MKKISILSLHLGYGGIEKSIAALANFLCDKYLVEIACCYRLYDRPVFDIDDRVKIKYLLPELSPNKEQFKLAIKKKQFIKALKEGVKALKILYLRRKRMISYIQNTDSEVVIATRDIFDSWLGEYGSSQMVKIGWEHNHYHNNFKYARNIVNSVSNLDSFVLVSKSLKDFYERELVKSKCRCVYIPNVIECIPPKSSFLNTKRLISVGRLSEEKGFLDLLKIYSIFHKDYPDWKLDIIGDGSERGKLEEFIKNYDLENSVKLHGFQNKEYIDKMFQRSSIYIMTSYTESFGLVLIEAMSHGIPCLAFDSAEGALEIIDSGLNGFLIKNRNFSAMIKKIEDLVNDIEARKRLGKAAREDSFKYTSEAVSKYWFDLIEKR